jgi:hypothetical protein
VGLSGPLLVATIPLGMATGAAAVVARIILALEALHRGPSKARRPSIRPLEETGPAGPGGEGQEAFDPTSGRDRASRPWRRRPGGQSSITEGVEVGKTWTGRPRRGIDRCAIHRKMVAAHLPAEVGVIDHAGQRLGCRIPLQGPAAVLRGG